MDRSEIRLQCLRLALQDNGRGEHLTKRAEELFEFVMSGQPAKRPGRPPKSTGPSDSGESPDVAATPPPKRKPAP